MNRLTLTALAVSATLLPSIPAGLTREPPRRVGIVVGAKGGAPGRGALRHAHRDAEAIADVLTSVGRFAHDDVHVLRDPSPGELLAVLQREAAALSGRPDALLFFYFSGHADQASLYSGGRPVPLEAVRRALDRQDVAVRIGVIDACQGGGWTRAKGLVPDAPFEVTLPQVLESEGSALISSSAGDESAHESDALGGSFFTVHLTAGLRGAADDSGDGEVTLTEAFEYARAQTIRDTARQAREPQHPTFALNLRGRQDIVLAQVAASPSTLSVAQAGGPLELVHLATGLRMLELPPGPRTARIAVPAGRYLVRRVAADGVRAREVDVPRQGQVEVREEELTLVASEKLAVKGPSPSVPPATPAARDLELSLGGMVSSRDNRLVATDLGIVPHEPISTFVSFNGRLGLTDRLAWRVGTLGFAYTLTAPTGTEIVPYGGLLGLSESDNFGHLLLGGGAAIRHSIGPHSFVATVGVDYEGWFSRMHFLGWAFIRIHASAGYGLSLGRVGSVNVGAMLLRVQPDSEFYGGALDGEVLIIGSVQQLGLAALPLVRLRLPAAWSLDLHAAAVNYLPDPYHRREFTYGASVVKTF